MVNSLHSMVSKQAIAKASKAGKSQAAQGQFKLPEQLTWCDEASPMPDESHGLEQLHQVIVSLCKRRILLHWTCLHENITSKQYHIHQKFAALMRRRCALG